jgi:hypothetical protein
MHSPSNKNGRGFLFPIQIAFRNSQIAICRVTHRPFCEDCEQEFSWASDSLAPNLQAIGFSWAK